MFCTKCGVQLEDRDCYCYECGTATGRAPAAPRQRRLYRKVLDKKIAGICSGLAEYVDADPTMVRLIWIMISLALPPAGVLGYLIAWIVVPKEQLPPVAFEPVGVPQT
jgi:phage shock protein C